MHDERRARPPTSTRIFTIPAGRPFLPALAAAVLAGDLPRPEGLPPEPDDLADLTILLPTRRAVRALQAAFLSASGRRGLLLPRIRPVAEVEEDLSLLSGLADAGSDAAQSVDIPPSISEIERRLVLSALVLKWAEVSARPQPSPEGHAAPYRAVGARTPAQAANLARELARLIDMVETEGACLDRLKVVVPDAFSEHWQKTLEFLEIVLAWWPSHLSERGLISPMDRRNRLIRAEATRLAALGARGRVIVAGVTGSIPATAELIGAVLGLEHGAVVLPGLDTSLDEASWNGLLDNPEHPQHGLAGLLARLDIARKAVRELPGAGVPDDAKLRATVVSEALRPAATTDQWTRFVAASHPEEARAALAGITCIEAPGALEEAETVSLILREALEVPGRTAALVTPDRRLARRVVTRLERWGIRVDDSAGRPFRKTAAGSFLELVVDTASRRFEPAALMALLKHPLARLGLPAGEARRAARALEIIAFRTAYFGRGIDGIAAAIAQASRQVADGARHQRAVRRLRQADWDAACDLLGRLRAAFVPLTDLDAGGARRPLADLVRAHVATAEAIARLPEEGECGSTLWQGEAGEAAALFLAALLEPGTGAPPIAAADYPGFYRCLLAEETVRPALPAHPRLSIWGPLEARLHQPDVLVIGSLNEGTWPASANAGPWLNREMRRTLGLPPPEVRIGRAAHDFTQLTGAARVYLTRAQKVEGAPTVPSRWLLRLKALIGGMGVADALDPDMPWLGWMRARDAVTGTRRIEPPAPRPPLALRPRRLSVSEVERWVANPYALYARTILELEPLPELGAAPGPSLRGAIVHEALGRFAARFPADLPPDPLGPLLGIARDILIEYTGNARVAAFWAPRLERFARWFAATEATRREGVSRVLGEVSGARAFEGPGGTFTLTARADRIDVSAHGLLITDYKTSGPDQVRRLASRAASGAAPQLPLEAAIALAGGFAGVAGAQLAGMRYIAASGGEPPGFDLPVRADDPVRLARETAAGLERLIFLYDQPSTPYRAVRRAGHDYRHDDFAHLARVAEWLGADPDEDGGDA